MAEVKKVSVVWFYLVDYCVKLPPLEKIFFSTNWLINNCESLSEPTVHDGMRQQILFVWVPISFTATFHRKGNSILLKIKL